jgi:Flp pilus assembly pilin Flp
MNPLNEPAVLYLRSYLGSRIHQLRTEHRSRGASAIEWAVITGLLAIIAITVGGIIWLAIKNRAGTIRTDNGTVGN